MFVIGKPSPKKSLIALRTKASKRDTPPREPIDLDRVVWDPAYRREVCEHLNRPEPKTTGQPDCKRRTG